MQYLTITLATLAATATASPIEARQAGDLCGGLQGVPQCCQVSVLGVLDLNCAAPEDDPQTVGDFVNTCNGQGSTAACCVLPAAGLGVVCQEQSG